MPIPTTCPNCGKTSQIKDKYSGRRGRCPVCGKVISVPVLELDTLDHDGVHDSTLPDAPSHPGASAINLGRGEQHHETAPDKRHGSPRSESARRRRERSTLVTEADQLAGIVDSLGVRESYSPATVVRRRRFNLSKVHPLVGVALALGAAALLIGLLALVLSLVQKSSDRLEEPADDAAVQEQALRDAASLF
ncbi:MAG: hypothetical protein R3C10_10340 [Pirellulales bacterium]